MLIRRASALSAGLILGLACAPTEDPPPPPEIAWDEGIRLKLAEDRSADPATVEIDLQARVARVEIAPGLTPELWTYDGALPGPLIRLHTGDRLIVHFRNALPDPTTIHWHGLRIPAAMDGAPGFSQPEIPAGGEFTYDFVVPDAGLYWYHPHVASAQQVGAGLYGAILVEDTREALPISEAAVLVLSDLGLGETGELLPPDSGGDVGTLFGREGQHVLVNGKKRPELRARSGVVQRWRVVNSAKSRYFQLGLAGHTFTVIGADGGWIEAPVEQERVVLAPGERLDLLVTPQGAPGSLLELQWIPFDRGFGSTEYRDPETILDLRLTAPPSEPPPALPAIGREIAPLEAGGATAVELRLTQEQRDRLVLGINGVPSWEAEPVMARPGETQIWTITNTMDWAHPFHLHGFFFQEVDAVGVPLRPLAWKDTVRVPIKGTTRVLVKFDDRLGMWMFHCHVLDHADAGMMGMLMLGSH